MDLQEVRNSASVILMGRVFMCRPALPDYVSEEFRKRVPKSVFATNPCRIQYCTQEIVVFREDILTKMCRNCVHFPETGDISTHVSLLARFVCFLVVGY